MDEMSDSWGGFANGQIPASAMKKVQNAFFKPDVADAIAAAIAECATHGVHVNINEGYRPLGIPADQNIRSNSNGDPVSKTSTGGSNQWFQYGRMKRGETPTAATPGGSIHGWGKAADVNPGHNNATVASVFAKHGFAFDISSESWHAHYVNGSTPVPPSPSNADEVTVQMELKKRGFYSGTVDGIFGSASWKAVQSFLKQQGLYGGAIDGIPGVNTYKGFQTYAKKGGYSGPVDGVLGAASWAGFAKALKGNGAPAPVQSAPVAAPVQAAPIVQQTVPVEPAASEPVQPVEAVKPVEAPAAPVKIRKPAKALPAPVVELSKDVVEGVLASASQIDGGQSKVGTMKLFSRAFWVYALERVIKTAAFTANSLLVSNGVGVLSVNWAGVASATGLAALSSLLVCLSAFKE
jgi:peptidoglycan hydrolase-like protein with peptidoglycan-binding domain